MALLPVMEVNRPLTGRRGVSLPFTDYCEPVVSHNDQFEEIFNYVTDYGKTNGWRYIEMRGGHGLPSQPYCFFKNIYDEIISKHMGFISLARNKDTAIAGNVYFHNGENVIFKYGASDKIYHHLRPNNLVMWNAIKWCCEREYKNLCFGKTEPDNDGLRQYKSGWGTKEHIIKYFKYDFLKDSFVKAPPKMSAFQHNIFKILPIPVLNALGTLLYRHMG